MKILNIYFKNINSLIGENRVDFDQAPLVDAGVFAITGPNGSGKTSILDAITLGLYGETFRFHRPSSHIMTKQTADCFAEVEFLAKGKQYRSTWRVARMQEDAEGELQQPVMQLKALSGGEMVLADQPNKVRDKVAELIGLDFSGFSRSIMLAQGDFAAFLNALDNERLDILEKLISTDIYEDHKQQILEKADLAKQQLKSIENKITQAPKVDLVKKSAIEEDLSDFNDQFSELRKDRTELNQQLNWLKNIAALEAKVISLKKAEQSAITRLTETEADLETIRKNQGILNQQPDIQAIDAKDAEIKLQQRVLKDLQDEARKLQEHLKSLGDAGQTHDLTGKSVDQQKQVIAQLNADQVHARTDHQLESSMLHSMDAKILGKKTAHEEEVTWLQAHQTELFLLDDFPNLTNLKNFRSEFKGLQVKQKNYSKWSETTTSALTKNKIGLEKLETKITKAKQKSQELQNELADITHGNTIDDIKELQTEQEQRMELFKDLLSLASAYKKMGGSGLITSVLAKPELDTASIKGEIDQVNEQITTDNNILKVLEKSIANEALLRKYQVERVLLVDNEPCPLCGALNHPYVIKSPILANSTQALNDQQAKIKALQAQYDALQKQYQLAQVQDQKNDKKQMQQVQIRSQWNSTCNKLNVANDEMTIDNISLMKKMLNSEKSDLKIIEDMQNNFLRHQTRIEKLMVTIKENEDMLEHLTKGTQKLEKDWNDRPQELKDLEVKIQDIDADYKQLSSRIAEQLATLELKLPKPGKEDILIEKLNEIRKECQAHYDNEQSLKAELEQHTDKVSVVQSNIKQLDQTIETNQSRIKQEEIIGLSLLLKDDQKLILEALQALTPLEIAKSDLQIALLEISKQMGISTLPEFREMLALVLRQSQIEQKKQQIVLEIEKLIAEQKQTKVQIGTEKDLSITELTDQELQVQLKTLMEKMDIIRLELNRLEKEKREINTIEQQLQILDQDKLQKLKDFQQCDLEVQQINAEKGAIFRRKVQKSMAEQLLIIANSYLDKISGRYYLHQRDTRQGLALEVEDSYKDNIRRLPETLSGGESFVVSLGLALGLSELANNGQSVDSLFLDEGFGNLDEEALYLVVSTLKNLKHHGKSVGVISHIKGVKERIHTQIEMSRNPNGTSGFVVVS